MYTPFDPIKVTHECEHPPLSNEFSDSEESSECDNLSKNENFSKQQTYTLCDKNGSHGVTAIAAVIMATTKG